jgi:glycosyltransferase involved in cell wall biosynthesis
VTTDLASGLADRLGTDPAVLCQLVEVVLPVHNEQEDLAANLRGLQAYLTSLAPLRFHITIAENGSTDNTWAIADRLSEELPGVGAIRLDQPGKGRAVREAWVRSEADIVAYMDVDMSTGMNAFLPMIAPLLTGHSDLAIGCRLAQSARVRRGFKREFLSRGYNILVRALLGARFLDGQCGFKAARRATVQALLPQVVNDAWFFDTELLVLAERAGLRIHEVPVDWIDDLDSRVTVRHVVYDDLKGIWRLFLARLRRCAVPIAIAPPLVPHQAETCEEQACP